MQQFSLFADVAVAVVQTYSAHACIQACAFDVGICMHLQCYFFWRCCDNFLVAFIGYMLTPCLKSHRAGKTTTSPCHSGDAEKSHQFVESHISKKKHNGTACLSCCWSFCSQVADALRTVMSLKGKSQHKHFFATNPMDMDMLYWRPASRDQTKPLLVQPQSSCNENGSYNIAVASPLARQ